MLASTTRGLLGRPADGGRSGAQRRYLVGQPGREPGHARRLQVLQLLRRERPRRAGGDRPHGGAAAARGGAAGRHLVLHLPGAQLHRRRLQGRDARPAQPDRLRAVRRLLPAPGGRPDHAGAEPAGAGGAAAHLERRPGPQRRRADRLGPVQEAGHRRQRRRDRQPRVLASRTRPSRCCGPASSPSACRSTPTSPPIRTSPAASPAGSASSWWSTSTTPTSPTAPPTSGGAGTSRCRRGSATTSTSRSAATAAARWRRRAPAHHVPGLGLLARRQLELRAVGLLPRHAGVGRRGRSADAVDAARVLARSAGPGRRWR